MIAQKAAELARVTGTVLVGDDTDPLVLLCYYACMESHSIYFKPALMKGTKKLRVWNILRNLSLVNTFKCKPR